MALLVGYTGHSFIRQGRQLLFQNAGDDGIVSTTISANATFDESSAMISLVNGGAANRNVTALATCEISGMVKVFYNAGSTNDLVLQSSAPATLATIKPGDWVVIFHNGSAWSVMSTVAAANTLATILSTANTWSALQTFGAGAALKDSVSFIYDNGDVTKKLVFQVSAVATATTRTITMPDADVALADVATNTANIAKFGSADALVRGTIAVADAPAGATTAALTLALTRPDGTAIATIRQVYITSSLTQYRGNPSGSATYGTATVGSIVASGTGWALVQTDATGAFACTVTDAADETLYFAITSPLGGVSNVAYYACVVGSNSDAATWSA